ncbi:HAD-IA family hydrolase [bacterium]|nr:HAD-IA family hydrolase [bacterium]
MIDLSRIRTVFFDADDTLYTVNGSVGELYAKHLRAHGYDVSADEINIAFPRAWAALSGSYENHEDAHRTSHERDEQVWFEYISLVMKELSLPRLPEEIFHAIYEQFGKAESRALQPFVQDMLPLLRQHGVTLGVLTNNDKRIHTLIPELGLRDHFSHIFCASDIGYKKPSRKVFEGIQQHVGARPEELLYIGDCPKNDVQGGLDAGWSVIWYNNEGIFPRAKHDDRIRTTIEKVPTIRCFSELVKALQQQKKDS